MVTSRTKTPPSSPYQQSQQQRLEAQLVAHMQPTTHPWYPQRLQLPSINLQPTRQLCTNKWSQCHSAHPPRHVVLPHHQSSMFLQSKTPQSPCTKHLREEGTTRAWYTNRTEEVDMEVDAEDVQEEVEEAVHCSQTTWREPGAAWPHQVQAKASHRWVVSHR